MSSYEQFVQSRVKTLEELLADIKAGTIFFCAAPDGVTDLSRRTKC
jgi:hypothetical protein